MTVLTVTPSDADAKKKHTIMCPFGKFSRHNLPFFVAAEIMSIYNSILSAKERRRSGVNGSPLKSEATLG